MDLFNRKALAAARHKWGYWETMANDERSRARNMADRYADALKGKDARIVNMQGLVDTHATQLNSVRGTVVGAFSALRQYFGLDTPTGQETLAQLIGQAAEAADERVEDLCDRLATAERDRDEAIAAGVKYKGERDIVRRTAAWDRATASLYTKAFHDELKAHATTKLDRDRASDAVAVLQAQRDETQARAEALGDVLEDIGIRPDELVMCEENDGWHVGATAINVLRRLAREAQPGDVCELEPVDVSDGGLALIRSMADAKGRFYAQDVYDAYAAAGGNFSEWVLTDVTRAMRKEKRLYDLENGDRWGPLGLTYLGRNNKRGLPRWYVEKN